MTKDWSNQVKEMDTVNLIVLVLTFLSVTFICWGLVVIYCCLASYCDSPGSSSLSSNASLKKFNQLYPKYLETNHQHQYPHHTNMFQHVPGLIPPCHPQGNNNCAHQMIPSSFHPHHTGHPSWNLSMFGHPSNDQMNETGKVMVPISDIVYI